MNFLTHLAWPVLVGLLFLVAACSTAPRGYSPNGPMSGAAACSLNGSGERLACIVNDQGDMRLEIRNLNGTLCDAHQMPGPILAVGWSSQNDLLVAGYRLREFTFGANLTQWLVRFNGDLEETITLGDVTIDAATVRQFAHSLPRLLTVAFSPSGDELVFTQVHDPPQFAPYLQLLYRNWQVSKGRRLLDLPMAPVVVSWDDNADLVTLLPVNEPPRHLPLWPAGSVREPGGDTGLQKVSGRPVVDDDRLWTLRRWRFEGLITPDEYVKAISGEQEP